VITDPLLGVALVCAVLVCFLSIGIRVLRGFSRHDLRELCEAREVPDLFSSVLRSHDRVALGLDMLVALATAIFVVSATAWSWHRQGHQLPINWLAAIGHAAGWGLVLILIRVAVPWTTSRLFSAHLLFYCWPVFHLFGYLSAPIVLLTQMADSLLHRIAGRDAPVIDEETLEEEIRSIVSEGHREGLLEGEAREMIEGVIELADADVAEIMTPRTDMHVISIDLTWEELLEDVIAAGHTRIPVYESTRDEIIGILYSKDLLPELAKGPDEPRRPLRELLRKPLFVPETKPVDDLLRMFQQVRSHIAIVLDEYGGVAGLVTIEDVLEEIVGEIVDEYDDDVEQLIRQLDDDTYDVVGRAHVDEVNDVLRIDLPEDSEYDTIGGFVFYKLGRIPSVGETIECNGSIKLTVVEATRRRIDRVRIELQNGQRHNGQPTEAIET
jgi:CBS domain containing-hemolysin-like protein